MQQDRQTMPIIVDGCSVIKHNQFNDSWPFAASVITVAAQRAVLNTMTPTHLTSYAFPMLFRSLRALVRRSVIVLVAVK